MVLGGGELLGKPLVLFGTGVAFLVGVDHEEAGVSVGEGVEVFGCGDGNVVVVVGGVLFVIAENGVEGHAGDEGFHAGEEVVDPLVFDTAGVHEVAGVEKEIGPLGPGHFGECSGDGGVALGVADDGEGEGGSGAGVGLEGTDFGVESLEAVRAGGFAAGAVEVLRAGLESFDAEFVNGAVAFGCDR